MNYEETRAEVMREFADEFRKIHEELKVITDRLGQQAGEMRAAKVLTLRAAAKQLSVSYTTFWRMVAEGRVVTVRVGNREMVPASEIDRMATPRAKTGRQRRELKRRPDISVQAEAARLKQMLKERHQ